MSSARTRPPPGLLQLLRRRRMGQVRRGSTPARTGPAMIDAARQVPLPAAVSTVAPPRASPTDRGALEVAAGAVR
ncbi:hypothetical protein [Dactylosporangium sp. CA-233914]|uniref:hypothetical protein n=1 Tax=Dactylosporangium sp. CA-233914 TaxID=3239934 RepID=UPI003D8AF3DB